MAGNHNTDPQLGWAQLVRFTEALAGYFRANMTLEEALDTAQKELMEGDLKLVVRGIHVNVRNGSTLTEAMAHFADSFPDYYLQAIRVGEPLAHLDTVFAALNRWCRGMRDRTNYWEKIKFHPLVAILVAFSATLLTWAVGSDIPLTSRNILVMVIPVVIFALVVNVLFNWLQSARGVRWVDHLKLNLPFFGTIYQEVLTTEVGEKMAVLTGAYIKPASVMNQVAGNIKNVPVSQELNDMAGKVKAGTNPGVALESTVFLSRDLGTFLRNYEPTADFQRRFREFLENRAFETNLHLKNAVWVVRGISYVVLAMYLMVVYRVGF